MIRLCLGTQIETPWSHLANSVATPDKIVGPGIRSATTEYTHSLSAREIFVRGLGDCPSDWFRYFSSPSWCSISGVSDLARLTSAPQPLLVVAFAVSIATVQTLPSLHDISFSSFAEYNQISDHIDRNLVISQIGLNVAECAVAVFCISGSLRVWRQRASRTTHYNTSFLKFEHIKVKRH